MKYMATAGVILALACGCTTGDSKDKPAAAATAAKPADAKTAQPAAAKPAPAPKPLTPKQQFAAAVAEASKSPWLRWRAAALEKLREQPLVATNAAFKLEINNRILSCCDMPGEWQQLWRYDQKWASERRLSICRETIASEEFTPAQKRRFSLELVTALAGERQYDEAEKALRTQMAYDAGAEKPSRDTVYDDWMRLADLFRWQDKVDEMVAAIEEARKLNPARATRDGSERALRFGDRLKAKVDAWWRDFADPYAEMQFFAGRDRDRCAAYARDFVICATNRPNLRVEVFGKYFRNRFDADAWRAREALASLDFAATRQSMSVCAEEIQKAFQQGAYARAVELRRIYTAKAEPPSLQKPGVNRLHVMSLGAIGRRQDAVRFARECLEGLHGLLPAKGEKGHDALDAVRYRVAAAILSDEDALKVIDAEDGLTRKQRMEATLTAARQCQIWNLCDAAERCAAKYMTYFATEPERRLAVKWSDRRIRNVTEWRAVEQNFEKQFCDVPFTGSMEFLETDVATGRKLYTPTTNDAKTVSIALSALADVDGLHLFLQTQDAAARKVEDGFAFGVGMEMYFAPGADQPYVCLMSSPRGGVDDFFQTSYTSAIHQRLDEKGRGAHAFRSETAFTDDGYVLHLFFPWDDFYQKLPQPGTDWKFECLAWCPGGARTWGGSQGVHQPSHWGNLRLDLTAEQLRAVKRGILYRAKQGWSSRRYADGFTLDRFQFWGDDAIGDPQFSAEALQPLAAELNGYVKRITHEMTDADVDEVYDRALVRIKGLKHEIDRLRKNWLAKHLCDELP